jgi:hypothetical protein
METHQLRPHGAAEEREPLSPAILPGPPTRCVVTTEKGDEATLTLAGYRLYFGTTYQIRVSGAVADAKLVGFPNHFVRLQGGPQAASKHGQEYRCIPIRVNPPGWLERLTRHGTYPHDLEVEVTLGDGRTVPVRIPVVLQLSLTRGFILLLVLWAVTTAAVELVIGATWSWNFRLLSSLWPWVWGLLLALPYPAVLLVRSFFTLWGRATELRQDYAARWESTAQAEP